MIRVDVADFDFELPEALIAQEPPAVRGQSRLLLLDRRTGAVEHAAFSQLPEFLRAGDLLVANDTKVFPSRLLGRRVPSGGAVECLLLSEQDGQIPDPKAQIPNPKIQSHHPQSTSHHPPSTTQHRSEAVWQALVHPGQKLKPGARVRFEGDGVWIEGEIDASHFYGRRTVRLWTQNGTSLAEAIDRIGHIPLPPYIRREDRQADRDRYQTVYARARGSIAAPTAGLHFTDEVLTELDAKGVQRVYITLHVGYGTFKPVRVERVEDHEVDPEWFTVSAPVATIISQAKRDRRRVIAVGTTTVRALESLEMGDNGSIGPVTESTRLFIHPGHTFRMVDAMVTNFHLPRSSLLMLVSAFAGREHVLNAYREAVNQRYRFYSYGDAMLIR